jgi:SAM-dependent methyltransferase
MIGWAGRVQKDSWPEECGQRLRENGCRTVLDFGCGLGQIGLALAGMGFEVTLAELFGSRHYPFLFRLAARVPGVRIRQTEVALADDDEGPWDAIICMEVFEHLACPDLMIRRLLAKLRPGGILFASWSFWPEGTTDTTRWPLHLQNGWTDERFEAFAERVCGLKWLNPGPCWHRILRKET